MASAAKRLYIVRWTEDPDGLLFHLRVCRTQQEAKELASHLKQPGVFNVAITKETQ